MEFVKRKEACEKLGIHYKTLLSIAERGEIKIVKIGKQQLYNVEEYMKTKEMKVEKMKRKICYCRVSSLKQKEDLGRQEEMMKSLYPSYEIIKDIGSGINYNRKGLQKLIKYALDGEIDEVVIEYKDRLTRFGYELIEYIIKEQSNGRIKILNKDEEKTPMEEMTVDLVSIMNVYVAKINGLRKYKKMIKDDLMQKIE